VRQSVCESESESEKKERVCERGVSERVNKARKAIY